MSKEYDEFKIATIKSQDVIIAAEKMRAVSDDFKEGFLIAMWEAREIYMRLDDAKSNQSETRE